VFAFNRKIVHGIYRDIILAGKDGSHPVTTAPFFINSIVCDGDRAGYFTKRIDNGVRIYIGNQNKLVDIGLHEY